MDGVTPTSSEPRAADRAPDTLDILWCSVPSTSLHGCLRPCGLSRCLHLSGRKTLRMEIRRLQPTKKGIHVGLALYEHAQQTCTVTTSSYHST